MGVFVHIGLIKTGSTFLQKFVFSQLGNTFTYVGPTGRFPDPSLLPLRPSLLISNENLGGNPIGPVNQQVPLFEQFKACIDGLCSTFSHPKLIIGFREPASFIQSVYKQHLHERGVFTWEEFLDHYANNLVMNVDFERYIRYAQSRMEPHELFLYRQDEFRERREVLIEELMQFLCLERGEVPKMELSQVANPSVSFRYESALRNMNRINSKFRHFTGKNLGVRISGKAINPTYICRSVLPRLGGAGKNRRDLSEMERAYADGWVEASEMIALNRKVNAEHAGLRLNCS